MAFDHAFIRGANRRASVHGLKFKIAYSTTGKKTGKGNNVRRKLTDTDVKSIRQWSAREGYGMQIGEQMTHLQTVYAVHEKTLREILLNQSRYDPKFVPFAPDETFWRGQSTTAIMVRVLRRNG